MSEFRFRSISLEYMDRVSPNVIFLHSYLEDLGWDGYLPILANL